MEKFVEQIHALGMKVMLWYSVPFVGWYAKKYKEFEGMYLNDIQGCNCSVLDPRYKKVREYLVNTYVEAAKKWKLDGFKLDFIDRFRTNGKVTPEMDFVSVEDAVECLLSEIHTALTKLNPEMLLEFRQPYYGPVVGAYGNMFRVWDCPLDGVTNKTWSTNLRLCLPNSAIHSDMIYCSKDDTLEGVSAQLFGTLFAVPQISTRFELITKEHEALLKNYLTFWNDHSDTLCNGEFKVRFTENGYSYIQSVLNGEKIALASAYTDLEIEEGTDDAYLFNITDENNIVLKITNGKKYDYEVFDCKGARITRKRLVRQSMSEIEVPFGAMLKVSLHR
jgi:alpha-galactosidase